MAELEKKAWWRLGFTAGAAALFAAFWLMTRNPVDLLGSLLIIQLLSSVPDFWLGYPVGDERDREIHRKSTMGSMGLFLSLLGIGLAGTTIAVGLDKPLKIAAGTPTELLLGGVIVIEVVRSVTSICIYHSGKKGGIRNNIRWLRRDAGEMTEQQLGNLAGVTGVTIAAIEARKYTPSLLLATKIARAFEKDVEDIFAFDSEQLTSTSSVEE